MHELKNCLKWQALYFLLFLTTSLDTSGLFPFQFPTDHISTLYLLFLGACLNLRYRMVVSGPQKMKTSILILSKMIVLLLLLRSFKYSIFGNISALGRYTWYLYYIPVLFIPLFLCFVSLFVYTKNDEKVVKQWGFLLGITVILFLFVFTNDFHQQVFRFQSGFANWDSSYTYGWGFIVVSFWEYFLYLLSFIVLVFKCTLVRIKYRALLILIPYFIGISLIIIIATGHMPKLNGYSVIQFPDTLVFMVASAVECCIQLGMIPSNQNYQAIMQLTSVPIQITDYTGNVLYHSQTAQQLTQQQVHAPNNTRIQPHTILRRMDIPGGAGFWQEDVSELDYLNEQLEETKKRLAAESELIRLQNEMKEKQAKIEQRTLLYDRIAGHTQQQSKTISRIARQALDTSTPQQKEIYRRQITLLASYIKRYANMMLLPSEDNTLRIQELALSMKEVLRYLNQYGIPGELFVTAEGYASADHILSAFETFEYVLEVHLQTLIGLYATLTTENKRHILKMTMENDPSADLAPVLKKLDKSMIPTQYVYEDSVGYFTFIIPAGGEPR